MRKIIILAIFLCFTSFVFAQTPSVVLLYVEDVYGRVPDDIIPKFVKVFEESVPSADYRLVKIKDFENTVKRQGLGKALEYMDILDGKNIAQLGKITGIDILVYINIIAYDENATKDKSVVFIQTDANFVSAKDEKVNTFLCTSRIEISEKKSLEKARDRALRDVVLCAILQSLNKEHISSVSTSEEIIGNKKSKLFHAGVVRHLPSPENTLKFKSIEDAKKEGFSPCPICFPYLVPSTENATSLELRLSSQISGFIENYYRVLYNERLKKYLDKIGSDVIKATPRQNLRYVFTILDTDEINAFAAGAGSVYITKGLLDIIESEDELAGVLAHEIAHNVKAHIVRQYRRDTNLSILGAILSGGSTDVGIEIAKSLFMLGYDRKYEREADNLALIYSIRAGFDPQGYIMVLKKLLDLEKSQPSKLEAYFRSHPPTPERIKRCEEFLADYNSLINRLGGK